MGDITNPFTSPSLTSPTALTAAHDLTRFRCGKQPLDDWLRLHALNNEGRSSRTYVVCQEREVVGYYCLATGAEKRESAPSKIRRNVPDPIPVVVLGRLAVHTDHQGKGIGDGLLKDALMRVAQVSKIVGSRAILVHAIDHDAMAFYVRYGFVEFPQGSRSLFLPTETIIRGAR
jgi:GNAT superfamily N-acetyltransferase